MKKIYAIILMIMAPYAMYLFYMGWSFYGWYYLTIAILLHLFLIIEEKINSKQ
jgi:hypothetical protein